MSASEPALTPVVEVNDLKVHFPVKEGIFFKTRRFCKAVDGVDLALWPGETLGVVGESGCGKSTLGKAICRLVDIHAGTVRVAGREINQLSKRAMRPLRREVQMVFQDPAESLNPRDSVGNILEEPLIIHRIGTRADRRERVAEALRRVGLEPDMVSRFPFEFSGGQRQRIGIARALTLNPRAIVCDEPVSALDVSVQSQILNLLLQLQRDQGLAYLFISHDLGVVRHVSDRIAVMYLGKFVEIAPSEKLFRKPLHAYTRALISAIPSTDPDLRKEKILLKGDVPSPIDPPEGCAFAHRTWLPCSPEEARQESVFREVEPDHWVELHPGTVENWRDYL